MGGMQIKGVALRSTLEAIEPEFGADTSRRVVAALPEEVRAALSAGVATGTGYPVAYQAALHDAVRSVAGGGDVAANRRLGARAARTDFGGVFRVFVLATSKETLLRASDRAFRRYNSQGGIYWDYIAAHDARAQITGVDGYTESMWHAVAGRLEALLILGGAAEPEAVVERWSSTGATILARWR